MQFKTADMLAKVNLIFIKITSFNILKLFIKFQLNLEDIELKELKDQSADLYESSTENHNEMIKVGTITEDGKNKLTDLDEMINIESADFCMTIKSRPLDSVLPKVSLANTFDTPEDIVGKGLLSEMKKSQTSSNSEIKMVLMVINKALLSRIM